MAWNDPPAPPGNGQGQGNNANPAARPKHESPRIRRLRSDLHAMEKLRDESTVLRFRATGTPVQHYLIELKGKSLHRAVGRVKVAERHEVEIKLGASYPRTMPEIRWLTPIYHPNISEIGMVCLGGYGTHWVPSLNLDELCVMLWDMARYHNYDVRSPYNREAALWVANQSTYAFPTDARPLRDLRAALGRVEPPHSDEPKPASPPPAPPAKERPKAGAMASKYASFVRNFADHLNSITPAGAAREPEPAQVETFDGLIIIEDEPEPEPAPPLPSPAGRPLVEIDEEIVFIE